MREAHTDDSARQSTGIEWSEAEPRWTSKNPKVVVVESSFSMPVVRLIRAPALPSELLDSGSNSSDGKAGARMNEGVIAIDSVIQLV